MDTARPSEYNTTKYMVSIPPPEVFTPGHKAYCVVDNCDLPGTVGLRIETVRSITYCDGHAMANLESTYFQWRKEWKSVNWTYRTDFYNANLKKILDFKSSLQQKQTTEQTHTMPSHSGQVEE